MDALMTEGEVLSDLAQRTARGVESADAVVKVDARSLRLVLKVQEALARFFHGPYDHLV